MFAGGFTSCPMLAVVGDGYPLALWYLNKHLATASISVFNTFVRHGHANLPTANEVAVTPRARS